MFNRVTLSRSLIPKPLKITSSASDYIITGANCGDLTLDPFKQRRVDRAVLRDRVGDDRKRPLKTLKGYRLFCR